SVGSSFYLEFLTRIMYVQPAVLKRLFDARILGRRGYSMPGSWCFRSHFPCTLACRTLLLVAALTLIGQQLLRGDCSLTSTGLIPLNDLGPSSYHGFIGGLYPAGSNTPPAPHLAAAVTIANDQIKPLDAAGNLDPDHGKIVMISIGMSNTTQEFATK